MSSSSDAQVIGRLNRPGSITDDERNTLRERYRWDVVGPNPL